jgi:hypothetical protein
MAKSNIKRGSRHLSGFFKGLPFWGIQRKKEGGDLEVAFVSIEVETEGLPTDLTTLNPVGGQVPTDTTTKESKTPGKTIVKFVFSKKGILSALVLFLVYLICNF